MPPPCAVCRQKPAQQHGPDAGVCRGCKRRKQRADATLASPEQVAEEVGKVIEKLIVNVEKKEAVVNRAA